MSELDTSESSFDEIVLEQLNRLLDMLETGTPSAEFIDRLTKAVEELGDDITMSVEEVFDISQWSSTQRMTLHQAIKERIAREQSGDLRQIEDRIEGEDLFPVIWNYCRNTALNSLRVVSAQVELGTPPYEDYSRFLLAPDDGWALIYVSTGGATIHGRGSRKQQVTAGELLLIPGGVGFSIAQDAEHIGGLVFISIFYPRDNWQRYLNPLKSRESAFISCRAQNPMVERAIRDTFTEIIDVSHSDLKHRKALHINLIEKLLLFYDDCVSQSHGISLDKRLLAACEFIQEHYAEGFTLDSVAAHAGTSTSTLAALFRNELNSNITRWRDNIRMQRARELLVETDFPIKAIAAEVGYQDPLFFSRRFKKVTGWSPTQVREAESNRLS